ncbi:MAG: 1,6-anhydro-N-acetylmuramyl-L-alanine amidase AmpD [Rhodocyclaceae bacterium]|nr:1,6-anhydro-N-acetylmuramyl-L-alanine amidase AmpD [Rhodocyclaceae bacterium]
MAIDRAGWLRGVRRQPSPNVDARPPLPVELLVVHNISLPPGEFGSGDIFALFGNRLDPARHPFYRQLEGLRVSAHFVVERCGRITQCVSVFERAWHAGVSCWQGRERCNDFSVGIELEGSDDRDFTEAQYAALAGLAAQLVAALPLRAAAGHSDIAPGRKTDPGPHFDWSRLALPRRPA